MNSKMFKRLIGSAFIVTVVSSDFFNNSNKLVYSEDFLEKDNLLGGRPGERRKAMVVLGASGNFKRKRIMEEIKNEGTPPIYLKYVGDGIREGSSIEIKICDIVELDCECIVNAARPDLSGGGGVDGAIHSAAGWEKLVNASKNALKLNNLNKISAGKVMLTSSCDLINKHKKTIKFIIHTVGPNVSGRRDNITVEDKESLKNCYSNCLDLAKNNGIHSIAFPAISTLNYGFPSKLAADLSLEAINEWLGINKDYEIRIILSCFNNRTYMAYKDAIKNNYDNFKS